MLRSELGGWAPLYRRIFDSDVWRGQNATTKVVAVWIIGRMRHTASAETPAGCIDCTLDEIGRECETTRNTTRNALASLQAIGFVEQQRSRWGLRLAVVAWQKWLACDHASSRRATGMPGADMNESSGPTHEAQPFTVRGSDFARPSLLEEDQEGSSATQKHAPRDAQDLTVKSKLDGYRPTIDLFHQLFVERYQAKPSWRAAEGAQLKRLLLHHGADEVQRRIRVLFDSPPRWLRPPFTFMTLVKNFDALVIGAAAPQSMGARRGGMSPAEILQRAAAMEGK